MFCCGMLCVGSGRCVNAPSNGPVQHSDSGAAGDVRRCCASDAFGDAIVRMIVELPGGRVRRGGHRRVIACWAKAWPVLLLLTNALPGTAVAQEAAEAAPNPMGKMRLVKFENTPFPFDGEIAEKGTQFLDVVQGDRRGHTSARGGVYWQDQTYSDKRVLLAFPRAFDPSKPVLLVVYFHGNLAKLERDVYLRQQVPRQVVQSGHNTVLVAPQFAVDALDSSAGRFWEPGMFRAFLDEAAVRLAELWGNQKVQPIFANAPVVLVAYSGGYMAAAFSLMYGDADDRVQGVVLLDALFGETDKFMSWIARKPDSFFVSAYTAATEGENQSMQRMMRDANARYDTKLPSTIGPGTIAFLSTPPRPVPAEADQKEKNKQAVDQHTDFVTRAWVADPLKLILARVPRPTHVAAPPPQVTVPTDPNYVARTPRPRPPSVLPGATQPLPFAEEVDITATAPPDPSPGGFLARWPERELPLLALPPKGRTPPSR